MVYVPVIGMAWVALSNNSFAALLALAVIPAIYIFVYRAIAAPFLGCITMPRSPEVVAILLGSHGGAKPNPAESRHLPKRAKDLERQ